MLKLIRARLAEGSTWAGISALLLANAMVMGEEYQTILGGFAIFAGLVAVLIKDPE